MSRTLLAAFTLALAGCALMTPAGEDDQGVTLKAAATPVLEALIKYQKDRGDYPLSLFELTPNYLRTVPFNPGLRYDRDARVIEFMYEHSMLGVTQCFAQVGDVKWVCRN